LCALLQQRLPDPYLLADFDDFLAMAPPRLAGSLSPMSGRGLGPNGSATHADGAASPEPDAIRLVNTATEGEPPALIPEFGPPMRRVIDAIGPTVRALVDSGNRVILNSWLADGATAQSLATALSGLRTFRVAWICSPSELQTLEHNRAERIPGLARGVSAVVHTFNSHDVIIDTTGRDSSSCVDELLAALTAWQQTATKPMPPLTQPAPAQASGRALETATATATATQPEAKPAPAALAGAVTPTEPPDRWFRSLAEASGDIFYKIQTDPIVRVEYMSASVRRWGGYTHDDYVNDPDTLRRILHPHDADKVAAALSAEPGRSVEFEFRWRHRDGSTTWTLNWGRRRVRPDGSIVLEGTAHDITELRAAQEELKASQAHYRLLAEVSSDFTIRTVRGFDIEWVSPSITRALGWQPEDLVGRNGFEFFHPNDVAGTREQAARMTSGEPVAGRIRLRRADGSYRWFSQLATPVLDADGELMARISGFQDVDAQVRAEQALTRSERRFRLAMEYAPVGMAVLDLERRFLEVNPALCRMLGRDEQWLLESGMAEVLDPTDDDLDLAMRGAVLSGRAESSRHDVRMRNADGRLLWAEHSVGLLKDDDGNPASYVSQFLDVTAAHEAREKLRFLAAHDALTSLANRHQLLERLRSLLSVAMHSGRHLAVLFVDLDNFKPVNDTHGHAAGDAVLVEVAERLRSNVRRDDVVARIGGDEFVLALPNVRNQADAEIVAAKVHRVMAEPIEYEGNSLRITVSLGLTMAQPGESADETLKRADAALYHAKESGRNRWAIATAHEGGWICQ
jgi:diguanylate cyclase (GGDEF)-like protein/PAS domain S-box-containing protein